MHAWRTGYYEPAPPAHRAESRPSDPHTTNPIAKGRTVPSRTLGQECGLPALTFDVDGRALFVLHATVFIAAVPAQDEDDVDDRWPTPTEHALAQVLTRFGGETVAVIRKNVTRTGTRYAA